MRPSYLPWNYGKSHWGDAQGNPAQTGWSVVGKRIGITQNRGPPLWFTRYNACPRPILDCSYIDRSGHKSNETCCQNLQPGQKCLPSCVHWQSFQETALGSDVGFYLKFKVDSETLFPYGCKGKGFESGGNLDFIRLLKVWL